MKISDSDNSSPEHHSPISTVNPLSPQPTVKITPQRNKPRGRPRGSKNKPKPPVYITADRDSSAPPPPVMKPVVLEVPAGSCVVEAITSYATKLKVGITVLNVSGSVTNVTLGHALPQGPSTLALHGSYYLLSLTGSFVAAVDHNNSKTACSSFGVTLAGLQGQAVGGTVAGRLTAATAVVVMAATFSNPVYHVLSREDDDDEQGDEKGESNNVNKHGYGVVANAVPISCQVAGGDWTTHGRSPFH